jgi:hypothetical protein
MTTLQPIPQIDTYLEFQADDAIPSVAGFFAEDLATVEVKPWARIGGLGMYINLRGQRASDAQPLRAHAA